MPYQNVTSLDLPSMEYTLAYESMRKILVTLLILFPCLSFAVSTADYSMAPPSGWVEHVKMFGMDVMYLGRVNGDKPQPVFGVMTQPKELSSAELSKFVEKSVKNDLAGRGISSVKVIAKGKAKQVQGDGYFMTYEYENAKGPMRDLAIVVRGKAKYHLLLFTAARSDFDFYYKDVQTALKSFKLAR